MSKTEFTRPVSLHDTVVIAFVTWNILYALICIKTISELWVLPLSLLMSDFLSGLLHWAGDSFLADDLVSPKRFPRLNAVLSAACKEFSDHHVRPAHSGALSYWAATYDSYYVATGITSLFVGVTSVPLWWALTLLHGTNSTYFHTMAHRSRPPLFFRMLQQTGLILTPARHRLHHQGAHDSNYCISMGVMNPLLDRIGFWRRLERIVYFITGIKAASLRSP